MMMLAVAAWALCAQDLTKEAVERASTIDSIRSTVEITLWHHSGVKEAGSILRIKGDGTVSRTWTSDYAILDQEKTVTQTLRLPLPKEDLAGIVRSFAQEGVLQLPRKDPRLIEPKEAWPKTMRYSVALGIPGVGTFEGEHPDVTWSRLEQSVGGKQLIQGILAGVRRHEEKVERLDAEFLSSKTLTNLLSREGPRLSMELHDSSGLWGGTSVRLDRSGKVDVLIVRPPRDGESGMQFRRSGGMVEKNLARSVFSASADEGTFDVKRKRETGIPDEGAPTLTLNVSVDGVPYSRSIWLFDGEASETPAFQKVRTLLTRIAKQAAKE